MLQESAVRAFRADPSTLVRSLLWLRRGKAYLKHRLAAYSDFEPSLLPYNEDLLSFLREQKQHGRYLVLCTASDRSIAEIIASHLGIFDEVMASNGALNLAGSAKATALVERFGDKGFDYAGNSGADEKVWARARHAIVVNASSKLTARAEAGYSVSEKMPSSSSPAWSWARRVLRVHQWLKNVLLFVPLAAAHQLTDTRMWGPLVIAFAAFCLCASSVYIANDLLDLESDRLHPRKRMRPFASGRVPIWIGLVASPVLLLISFALALLVNDALVACLFVYFVLTSAYSFYLKRLMLVDCITLALLYTLRVIAGVAVVGSLLSFWLLAFSVFLFLSLAFVKRYAELEIQLLSGQQKSHGRGYLTTDAPLIQTVGVSSGFASILVLALYLNSDAVIKLYRTPEVVWGVVPIMIFWVSWMWLVAHRGEMHDDPVVFAVKDRASWVASALFVVVLWLATLSWPW
jgi:4-hydroxybenzoate polyprenyltransferase/phosphoserine phosphatase